MNVVHAGSTYQIYGESVKTYNLLPTRTYEVCFNKMTGFYLSSRNNLIVQEEKIYGEGPRKVIQKDKIDPKGSVFLLLGRTILTIAR